MKQVARKWEEAGDLFLRAAELEDKAGESAHQAANGYMEACKCYQSADIPGKAATASRAAQERFLEMGRFTQVMDNTDVKPPVVHFLFLCVNVFCDGWSAA